MVWISDIRDDRNTFYSWKFTRPILIVKPQFGREARYGPGTLLFRVRFLPPHGVFAASFCGDGEVTLQDGIFIPLIYTSKFISCRIELSSAHFLP